MKDYFYKLLFNYLSLYIFTTDKLVSIFPVTDSLVSQFPQGKVVMDSSLATYEKGIKSQRLTINEIKTYDPDFILLNWTLHYERDIQKLLEQLGSQCHSGTRLIVTYYSSLWKPIMRLATFLGLRKNMPEENWIAPEDVNNLLHLSGFEIVRSDSRVLFPLYIPLLSNLLNRYLAPLPFFRAFNLVNIAVARSVQAVPALSSHPSVSVVVAARNEEGNIDNIIQRLPQMGPDDELIFIEGNSTDNTWGKIQEVYEEHKNRMNIQIGQQEGQGKGDAVRKGFAMAKKDILMILDADLTVPPEDLPRFYKALVSGKGEYINGSRLVYPMEEKAMRFFNILGNKFFALAFSFVLGQRFKDTLCGTKVLTRKNYQQLVKHREYFGDFDPFGDFDLIFGSARMCLKIVELPITYRERTYGNTNISRWSHGRILLRMLFFAARKIKFI
jgi:glycosyl transferase family 2